MKKKIVALLLVTSLVISTAACGADSSNESKEPDKPTEQAQTEKAQMANAGETGDAAPETDSSSDNSSTDKSQLQMLDEATKNAIKEFVEPCIDDIYKTTFYTCDVLTPNEGSGGIVSVQIENPSFTDEGACKEAIKSIIGRMLGDVRYKNINSFEFYMLADSHMKFIIEINDAQSITSADDISGLIDITGY